MLTILIFIIRRLSSFTLLADISLELLTLSCFLSICTSLRRLTDRVRHNLSELRLRYKAHTHDIDRFGAAAKINGLTFICIHAFPQTVSCTFL